MSDYYFLVLKYDLETLDIIKADVRAGESLAVAVNGMALRSNRIPSNDTDSEFPVPEPIVINGAPVGHVIGRYYDGFAPGLQLRPIPMPPQTMGFCVNGDRMETLGSLKGRQIVATIRSFHIDPDRDPSTALHAVFNNCTDEPFALCIVKTSPFRCEDGATFELNRGHLYNIPPNYRSLRSPS